MNQSVTAVPQQVSHLYTEHHLWLVGWISRRVSSGAYAEDLAQNTFLRLLGKSELPALQSPKSYLATVANGLVANFYRRQDIELAYLQALELYAEEQAASPELIQEHLELLVQVSQMLDGLPEKVTQAFLLVQLDGLLYRQVAERLGISISSVKQYMFQAMRHCLAFKQEAGLCP